MIRIPGFSSLRKTSPAPEVAPAPAPATPVSSPAPQAGAPPLAPATAPAPAPATPPPPPAEPAPTGWLARLRQGLVRSSSRIAEGITAILTRRRLDDEALEELEDLLITADLGPTTAARLTAGLRQSRFGKEVSPEEIRGVLAEEIAALLAPVAQPLVPDSARKPHVILVVGVNGTGKTTTIGKFARQYRQQGKSVILAAGDTFRAAAIDQLKIWGERTGCPVIARDPGADAAGLAFEALEQARARAMDVLLIDTAGRLHNKSDLMAELQKVIRVLRKLDPTAPHTTLLTLDATTGQNAHAQVEVFQEIVGVNSLVLTKLDGSARGGVLVALAEKFGLPVHAIGVGEGPDDLRPFEARSFARSLMGLDN